MGLTGFSFDTLIKHANLNGKTMLELGDQNIYFGDEYGTYSTPYFKKHYKTLEHICIDIKPEKHAVVKDLREPLDMGEFDIITNWGTTEHVAPKEGKGLYEAFKNVHDACKVGGLMFHENPKTGNWPGHGDHYMTKAFYSKLVELTGYELLELDEHAAMHNTTDGWNIYAVLRKQEDKPFISKKAFNQLDFRNE